jgi:hypothetical protein
VRRIRHRRHRTLLTGRRRRRRSAHSPAQHAL